MSSGTLRALAMRGAASRGHALVLVYHLVVEAGAHLPWRVVPAVSMETLRQQLQIAHELADVVDLPQLLKPAEDRRRPRIGITFDDDYREHVTHALPVLQATGTRATFFLGGRQPGGAGAYWWQHLEARLRVVGPADVAADLGLATHDAQQLAEACEASDELQARLHGACDNGGLLDEAGIRTLAASRGITVGFHTVDHPVLPRQDDEGLAEALRKGRSELASLVGRPLSLLAYPHGKADERVATAASKAGYDAAWTGWPRPMRRGEDPMQLGRWECGDLDADSFARRLAVRLHRVAPR